MRAINKLTMSNFRGATRDAQIDFGADKAFVMLYGENGTGKSTVIDAIDMICNKSLGSLAERADVDKAAQYPAQGKTLANVGVTLTDGAQSWKGSVVAGRGGAVNVNVAGAVPTPRAYVLRRGPVLNLTVAAAGDKYKALAEFIDLTLFAASEANLNTATNTAEAAVKTLTPNLLNAIENLDKIRTQAGSAGASVNNARQWADEVIRTPVDAQQQEFAALTQLLTNLDAAHAASELDISAEPAWLEAQRVVKDLEQQIKSTGSASANADLIRLLEQAQTVLKPAKNGAQSEFDTSCPVCLQAAAVGDLLAQIEARLKPMTGLRNLMGRLTAAKGVMDHACVHFEQRRQHYTATIHTLAVYVQGVQATQAGTLAYLNIYWEQYDSLLAALPAPGQPLDGEQAERRHEQANAMMKTLFPRRHAIEQRIYNLQRDITMFNDVKRWLTEIRRLEQEIETAEVLATRLAEAKKILADKRKNYVDSLFAEVAAECDRLYQSVHPNEALGFTRLTVVRNASLSPVAMFGGQEAAPQGL